MREVFLGVQPHLQPKPNRNASGDCFACALTAAMRHLFPDRPPPFEQVWSWFEGEYSTGGKCLSNGWEGMRCAIQGGAPRAGYPLDTACDVCQPSFFAHLWPHDFHWQPPEGLYSQRLEAYLRAGYVALTCIAFDGPGPVTPEFYTNMADHFVLLDGVREPELNHREIHVVCSVKGGYWISEMRLLRQYGAGAWWLVRRKGGEP